jgi:sarcosine oxidase subunit gamma
MSELLRRLPALGGVLRAAEDSANQTVVFTERAFLCHFNLRGNPHDPSFTESVRLCLGVPLPVQPNTVAENDRVTVLWLGPDEWLLITAPSDQTDFVMTMRSALRGCFSSVVNITDGQTILRISGLHAVDVLQKGCGLNFDRRVFGPGCCAQTQIAKAGVVIHHVDALPVFDIIVRRSFTEYLALWLNDAVEEYLL